MSAATHLAQFGVTVAQAREYVFANIDAPLNIFNTAHQFGISNAMLAEIVGGGFSAADVRGWLWARDLDASLLDPPGDGGNGEQSFLPAEMQAFAALVSLNNNTGDLSSSTLHDRIVAHTGVAAYNDVFNPAGMTGAADGILSATDLGIPGLPDLPATLETVESLYFGTAINMLRAVDQQEIINEILPFALNNKSALAAGDAAVLAQYLALLQGVFADPATQPMFADSQIADMVVYSGVTFVGIVQGGGDGSVFDGVLQGILPIAL